MGVYAVPEGWTQNGTTYDREGASIVPAITGGWLMEVRLFSGNWTSVAVTLALAFRTADAVLKIAKLTEVV